MMELRLIMEPRVELRQTLIMTPQLQQAIKLLQLSRLELQELMVQEMTENPVLEEEDLYDGEDSAEAAGTEPDEDGEYDWEAGGDRYGSVTYVGARPDDKEAPWEQVPAQQATLMDYLRWQLRMQGLEIKTEEIGFFLIGNIDEDGYLRETTEGIAEALDVPAEEVERVLDIIHALEPSGVGARDLRECLLIQLRSLAERNAVAEAIVERHLSLCGRRDYRGLARALRVRMSDVITAVKVITTLEPKPGRPFSAETAATVVPDVFVYKVDGDYAVVLNEDGVPHARINSYYRKMLADKRRDAPREYLQEKMKSATWLLRSIRHRQATLYKVTSSIVKFQRMFLDHGIEYLQPLIMRDVADDLGVSDSTVSRATSNKYVHTPQGLYELKFFFSGRIGHGREEVAVKTVKSYIRRLVSDENPKKPLSDDTITRILRHRHQINIARRTVAKYRDTLQISSSFDRKRLW